MAAVGAFNGSSALRLEPWATGDASGLGPAVVSPVRGASAAASSRGSLAWSGASWAGGAGVESASGTVDVESVLLDEGSQGAEKVLETADTTESCESWTSWMSCAWPAGMCGVWPYSG